MRPLKPALLATAATLMFLFSCSRPAITTAQADTKPEAARKPAPNFTLKDASGTRVELSSYHGKVVLLNFWATWCGPCEMEIPWFVEFEQQFKSKGFEVVGVSMDDDGWPAVKPFIAAKKINYRILLGDDSVTQLYGGVDALPTTFMIDRDGRIAAVHVGLAGKDEYSNEIQNLLANGETTDSGRRARPVASLLAGSAK
ncbi:MAG TPA: TlpA disulfide reductase family protein [Bryobacteraceae bacterium]|nr:TlpA disulfide reductase family protein [Bryobacteraceae bacterium]